MFVANVDDGLFNGIHGIVFGVFDAASLAMKTLAAALLLLLVLHIARNVL